MVRARQSAGIATFTNSMRSTPRSTLAHATKAELEAAMKGHVLAKSELIGTYQKGDR